MQGQRQLIIMWRLDTSIVVVSDVDTSTVGDYTVTYNVTDTSGSNEVTRTVNVYLAPVILFWRLTVTIEINSTYTDAGQQQPIIMTET